MICEICHKNEATIHVQEVVAGSKKTLNICPVCAAEQNIGDDMNGFNLAEMLYNISSQILQGKSDEPQVDGFGGIQDAFTGLKCKCGWDTSKFRDGGRLGCAECYNVFAPILVNALHGMHKGSSHVGKQPADAKKVTASTRPTLTMMNMQKELEECIQSENYERAAVLRDKINAIKSNTGKKRKGEPAA